MEIKTKFNIGDTVYPIFVSKKVVVETCETCNGVGSVKINNTDRFIDCPDCYHGEIERCVDNGWVVRGGHCGICGIETKIYSEKSARKSSTLYHLDKITPPFGYYFDEENLFTTEEEAQKECELRNNKQ